MQSESIFCVIWQAKAETMKLRRERQLKWKMKTVKNWEKLWLFISFSFHFFPKNVSSSLIPGTMMNYVDSLTSFLCVFFYVSLY